MSKFNLFGRSALASMAASVGLGIPAADAPRENDDDNPEAGPKPADTPEQPTPAATPDTPSTDAAPADNAGADAAVGVVTLADANAHAADQYAAGRKAERERTAAVLGSDIGKANPSMAAWMLSTSPDAGADAIIAQLGTLPGAAPAASTAPAGIPDTNVDLGKPGAAAAVADGGGEPSGDDIWKDVQGKNTAPVVNSDAGRATLAALNAGARTVNVGGNAASPATPAVAPTGN